jgi:hypothetical protein
MTTQVMAAPGRTVRDALLAGLAGVVSPHLAALAWALLASAVWGIGPRVAAFLDPTAARPTGYAAASLLVTIGLGAVIGAGIARGLARRPGAARWTLWAAFAAGVLLSAALMGAAARRAPVLPLFIAASALGFRLGARG